MIPYSSGIILDNTNNYGIVKTETVFRFTPTYENIDNNDTSSSTIPLDWIYSDNKYGIGASEANKSARSLKRTELVPPEQPQSRRKKVTKSLGKKHKKGKSKFKKCILKVIKKGKKGKKGKSKHKKYMMALILGLLAVKSLLIPIALKALAFISAKGLMMGLFSTMLASVLSLKGMFDHSHAWNRREDAKTQVEIIQVPSKSDEHVYYDHYKRGDRLPLREVK